MCVYVCAFVIIRILCLRYYARASVFLCTIIDAHVVCMGVDYIKRLMYFDACSFFVRMCEVLIYKDAVFTRVCVCVLVFREYICASIGVQVYDLSLVLLWVLCLRTAVYACLCVSVCIIVHLVLM